MSRFVKRDNVPLVIITVLLMMQLSGCVVNVYNGKSYPSPKESAQASAARSSVQYEQTPAPIDSSALASATQSEDAQTTPATQSQAAVPNSSDSNPSCTPWQLAYVALLKKTVHDEDPSLINSYSLYDVDKDTVPEIFIKIGEFEADYQTKVYTFKNGAAVYIGDFESGESYLCTWPNKNAVLFDYGHMGYAYMSKISIVDGKLVIKEIFSEDIKEDEDYTAADKIVPGAVSIQEYQAVSNSPPYTPMTLPILNYYSAASSAKPN